MHKSAPVLGVALGLLFFSGVAAAASAIADPSAVTNAIHERVELVRAGKPLTIGGDPIVSRLILPRFYETRCFQAAWGPEALDQLQRAIEQAFDEGLNPDDYHRRALTELMPKLRAGAADGELAAEADILATDAVIRLAYHLFFGKVDPEALDPDWNAARLIDGKDPVALMESAIAAGRGRLRPGGAAAPAADLPAPESGAGPLSGHCRQRGLAAGPGRADPQAGHARRAGDGPAQAAGGDRRPGRTRPGRIRPCSTAPSRRRSGNSRSGTTWAATARWASRRSRPCRCPSSVGSIRSGSISNGRAGCCTTFRRRSCWWISPGSTSPCSATAGRSGSRGCRSAGPIAARRSSVPRSPTSC